jgi:hypothetical protein
LTPLLVEHASWLFTEFKFSVIHAEEQNLLFGDSVVDLRSDRLRLRIERSQGKTIVHFGPPGEARVWHTFPTSTQHFDVVLKTLRESLPALLSRPSR